VGIGACGYSFATRRRLPALTVVLPAIIPMLPGLTIYSAMLQLTQGDSISGVTGLLRAATDALALAAGVILGEFLAQPLRRQLSRRERRYAGPRMVGPLRVSTRRRSTRRLSPRRVRRDRPSDAPQEG
jgi:uncharacterized membrane protein YjjB (DUF3815 family)